MGDINYDHELVCIIEKTGNGFRVVCKCGCIGGTMIHTHHCDVIEIFCECGGCRKKKKNRIICRCNKENPPGPR